MRHELVLLEGWAGWLGLDAQCWQRGGFLSMWFEEYAIIAVKKLMQRAASCEWHRHPDVGAPVVATGRWQEQRVADFDEGVVEPHVGDGYMYKHVTGLCLAPVC